ncbi:MAG: nucleotidyl transferase AbiEii/AbiGii toxin family protein [Phycisphaerales bacterium]|nr:nucleotidyl transferase AbiEii/AbiGii toxin family protein [Phycisphaerales bacterium]
MYSLPDLFAGKMHAVLCRRWKTRVTGRDWYDFVWYAGHHPELNLGHLEARMRHSGDWTGGAPLDADGLQNLLREAIGRLDVRKARQEVDRFVKDKSSLDLWSHEFFLQVARQVKPVGTPPAIGR